MQGEKLMVDWDCVNGPPSDSFDEDWEVQGAASQRVGVPDIDSYNDLKKTRPFLKGEEKAKYKKEKA